MADTKLEELSPAYEQTVAESGSTPPEDVTTPEKDAPRTDDASPPATTTAEPALAPTESEKPGRIPRKPVSSTYLEVDKSKPHDFDGEVLTNNELPSPETLKKIEDYIVLDRDGRSHAFKTLYSGTNVARRVLMIFIRHFFCGVGSSCPWSL